MMDIKKGDYENFKKKLDSMSPEQRKKYAADRAAEDREVGRRMAEREAADAQRGRAKAAPKKPAKRAK